MGMAANFGRAGVSSMRLTGNTVNPGEVMRVEELRKKKKKAKKRRKKKRKK